MMESERFEKGKSWKWLQSKKNKMHYCNQQLWERSKYWNKLSWIKRWMEWQDKLKVEKQKDVNFENCKWNGSKNVSDVDI